VVTSGIRKTSFVLIKELYHNGPGKKSNNLTSEKRKEDGEVRKEDGEAVANRNENV
jgi:hypothetical protein